MILEPKAEPHKTFSGIHWLTENLASLSGYKYKDFWADVSNPASQAGSRLDMYAGSRLAKAGSRLGCVITHRCGIPHPEIIVIKKNTANFTHLTVKKALVRFVLRELHKSDNFSKINKVLVLNEQLEP